MLSRIWNRSSLDPVPLRSDGLLAAWGARLSAGADNAGELKLWGRLMTLLAVTNGISAAACEAAWLSNCRESGVPGFAYAKCNGSLISAAAWTVESSLCARAARAVLFGNDCSAAAT